MIGEFHYTVGHPDPERTYSAIFHTYYWPKDVKDFHKLRCKCQRIKPRTDKPYRSSMPLPVPTRAWDSGLMDFVTNLPNVDGYDEIFTVVCTLSKMAHFIPCNSMVDSRQLAKLFLENIYKYRLHGLL